MWQSHLVTASPKWLGTQHYFHYSLQTKLGEPDVLSCNGLGPIWRHEVARVKGHVSEDDCGRRVPVMKSLKHFPAPGEPWVTVQQQPCEQRCILIVVTLGLRHVGWAVG